MCINSWKESIFLTGKLVTDLVTAPVCGPENQEIVFIQ